MEFLTVARHDSTSVVTLAWGKVNAIDETVVQELSKTLANLAADSQTSSVVLTGSGKFFSFGFDVPHFQDYPRNQFALFIESFCRLYRELFLFPKPLIAALNGHAVAGGCVVALACHYRILTNSPAKVGLNEVTFGATLWAGAIEMLRFVAGGRNAETVVLTGKMFSPEESLALGLVDEIAAPNEVLPRAIQKATELSAHLGPAYTSLKRLVRQPIADEWSSREEQSIQEWLDIWYSPETREKSKSVQIRR